MGTKRSYSESNDLTGVHASRQGNLQQQDNHAQKRVRKPQPFSSMPASMHLLKKKIRDTTRLLEHAENMPAGVRIENERALAGYKQELEAADEGRRKSKMIKRYHMVRFFERRKATRHMKKLQKRLAEASDVKETKRVEGLIHNAEVDLNYTIYCPLDEKYTGLYPRKQDSEDEEAVTARHMGEKPWLPLWKVVERCMEEGTLEALRNSNGQFEAPTKEDSEPEVIGGAKKKRSPGLPSRPKRSLRSGQIKTKGKQDANDESDGGFFEE
ncbi:MAG: 18S rRNA maturation protein [Pleopsidium flavum]|nr:MAG: 18S rRNA maturation protein [Pleopsidium flavum]